MLKEKPQGAATPSGLVMLNDDALVVYQAKTDFATHTDDLGEWHIGDIARVVTDRLVERHYRVPPTRARLVVELAGLGRRAAA